MIDNKRLSPYWRPVLAEILTWPTKLMSRKLNNRYKFDRCKCPAILVRREKNARPKKRDAN